LSDRDGDGAVARRGWYREWRIWIWSWTIDWSNDYWLVETVRHRFLGEEIVHRYSWLLWQLMVWAAAILTVIMVVSYAILASAVSGTPDIDSPLALLGFIVALMVISLFVVLYFTFVPPKEYRTL